MMQKQLNHMRQLGQMATQAQATTRIGIVTSYDPNTYSVKVMLQPENLETGWLPVTSAWIGNGWGIFCPPSSGDMVEVQFQEDGQSAGFIVGRFFNDIERPLPAPSGEFWLVHKSGSLLKFHNDGSVELVTNQDLNATVGRHANISVTGNIVANVGGNVNATVSGNITSSAASWAHTGNINVTGTVTASTDVIGGGKSLKSHVHSGVVPGGGTTGAPV